MSQRVWISPPTHGMFESQRSVDHAPLQEHPVDVIHGAAVAENSEKRATRVEHDLI